jgi:hypothetical protein
MIRTFIFAVVGDEHIRRASLAISFLKRFTRHGILLVHARGRHLPAHEQSIAAEIPPHLTDHQASIYLKVSLTDIVTPLHGQFCYLDSDVIAVDSTVDEIFDQPHHIVSFARDHARIDDFSRYAVRCFCSALPCRHLRENIVSDFGVEIDDGNWTMWNGGVFRFGQESVMFMNTWRRFTLAAFRNPFWRPRDQGTLAATAWHFGLQHQPLLERRFNHIIDRFAGIPEARRSSLPVAQFSAADFSSLLCGQARPPCLLHFINGGIGQTGWRPWDDVARLSADQGPE